MDKELECRCCDNCKKSWMDRCPKMRSLPEWKEYENKVKTVKDYLEDFSKRLKIKKSYCCDYFENRWLQYPIAVKDVKVNEIKYNAPWQHDMGSLVKIRPCGDEYGNKTYLGFYLGDLPYSISQSFNPETNILTLDTTDNPAIFVPELKKIIFGFESWWGVIENEEELKDITNNDINNQWYIRLLKDLSSKEGDSK